MRHKGGRQGLGSDDHTDVDADAITDRIVQDAIWAENGVHNMREHTAGQVKA
ncbi:hypothetical protein [Glaciibacter psychrotolerans]|uniref:Uncharacterized protein n=1 Tax=Glaciibacter psychrotolerans TaxID=670054 RepID=A0A7Z0J5L8_9MICO|nr:hypothetical protein [Leifsonia psychrotolerans]NYJ19550.1 hypothetical protein [Leifsonia psychrotolerans]